MGNPTRVNKAIHDKNYHFPIPTEEVLERNIPSSGAISKITYPASNTQAIIGGERVDRTPRRNSGRRQWSGNSKVSMRQTAGLEHRHDSRHKTLVYVDIHHNDETTVAGVLYNISCGGMFVLCNRMANINRCVNISLPISYRDRLKTTIPGFVVHRNHYGFGLMFRELDEAGETVVNKLLSGLKANT